MSKPITSAIATELKTLVATGWTGHFDTEIPASRRRGFNEATFELGKWEYVVSANISDGGAIHLTQFSVDRKSKHIQSWNVDTTEEVQCIIAMIQMGA